MDITTAESNQVGSYIGACVSIEMKGGMGYFQGIICDIDGCNQQIKLTSVIHDGRPTKVKEMKFSAEHIKTLEVLADAKGHEAASSKLACAPSALIQDTTKPNKPAFSSVDSKLSQLQLLETKTVEPCAIKTPSSSNVITSDPSAPTNVEAHNLNDAIHDFLNRTNTHAQSQKTLLSITQSLPLLVKTAALESSSLSRPKNNIDATSKMKIIKLINETESQENPCKKKYDVNTSDVISRKQRSHQQVDRSSSLQTYVNRPEIYGSHDANYGSKNAIFSNNDYNEYPYQQQPSRSRRGEIHRQKNENTFGFRVHDTDMNEDFDFEENNKLFDKQAVAEEINQMMQEQQPQPDIVSQTDGCIRGQRPTPAPASDWQTTSKFRHDENVLAASKTLDCRITLPADEPTELVYTTDSGFLVPGVSTNLRQRLQTVATQLGFTVTRQHEVVGRAATELCLQLLGGEHRLNDRNSHQVPRVLVLCGCHLQGSLGINTARQLQTHNLLTTVVTPSTSSSLPLPYTNELKLYNLCDGTVLHSTAALDPALTFDLILDARLDHEGAAGGSEWCRQVTAWARQQRCPVVGLEPPSHQHASPLLPARALVVAALPLVYSEQQGRVHLVKLALPTQAFQQLFITYASPFQAKLMIPLHPCD